MVYMKINPQLDSMPAWFRQKKEQYRVGIDSGEYDLPLERPYWETGSGDDTHEGGF